jgi:hypothetical protein
MAKMTLRWITEKLLSNLFERIYFNSRAKMMNSCLNCAICLVNIPIGLLGTFATIYVFFKSSSFFTKLFVTQGLVQEIDCIGFYFYISCGNTCDGVSSAYLNN